MFQSRKFAKLLSRGQLPAPEGFAMRRPPLVLAIAIAFLPPATTTAAADWSMADGDAARTGSTTAEPSAFPGFLWGRTLPGPVLSAPVVSRNPGAVWNATVYVVTGGTLPLNALDTRRGVALSRGPLASVVLGALGLQSEGGGLSAPGAVFVLLTAQNRIHPAL